MGNYWPSNGWMSKSLEVDDDGYDKGFTNKNERQIKEFL